MRGLIKEETRRSSSHLTGDVVFCGVVNHQNVRRFEELYQSNGLTCKEDSIDLPPYNTGCLTIVCYQKDKKTQKLSTLMQQNQRGCLD